MANWRRCEDEIEKSKAGNRREILQRIERQFLEQGDADRGAVGEQRQRIAVRRRRYHRSRRGDAAGAGLILDVKALPELVAEFVRDDARGDVGDAAGGERQHDAHGPVGIAGLRAGCESATIPARRVHGQSMTRRYGGAARSTNDMDQFLLEVLLVKTDRL